VSHEKGTQNFLSYQLTDVGLVTTPVITAAGLNYFGNNRYGYLKFSSDGSLLCSTLGGTSTDTTVQLFSFDSQTGIVSNPIALAFNGQTTNAYSSEFSADMTKLYVVAFNGNFIDQYDITSGVRATIIASRIDVGGGGTVKSCVQMGPDGRIYVSRNGTTFLGAITQPDASGAACNYVDNAVNLGSGRANLGFPNFIQSYFRKFDIGNDTAICQGNTVIIDVTRAGATYLWQDGSTNPVYAITQTGSYNVFVQLYSCFLRDTIQVTVQPVPVVNLGSDTSLCAGQSLALNATTSGATYQWNDNSTMPTLQVNNSGAFAVTVTVNGCSATDNMVVAQSNTPPAFSLGNDTAYCNAFSATLSAGSAALWSTGVTAPQIAVNAAGTYWASVSSGCGTASDTIVIIQATVPIVNLGNDTALCSGATLLLGAFNAGATYLWQDASTGATYNVLGAGIYAVTVTGQQGCTATDAINVSSANPPAPIQLGSDTTYCGSFTLTITTGNANTLWSTGTTASQINVNSFGTYWAAITNGCGTASDTIVITQAVVPVVNLGNDTALCNGATLLLGAFNAGATYLWQDASTGASYNVAGAGSYTVTVTSQQGCTATDAINVNSANPPGPINLGNDTAYCGSFTRIITTGNANTVWSYRRNIFAD
jgi:hypothetical protein